MHSLELVCDARVLKLSGQYTPDILSLSLVVELTATWINEAVVSPRHFSGTLPLSYLTVRIGLMFLAFFSVQNKYYERDNYLLLLINLSSVSFSSATVDSMT